MCDYSFWGARCGGRHADSGRMHHPVSLRSLLPSLMHDVRGSGTRLGTPTLECMWFLRRLIRATRIAATDQRIPRPLRWFAAFALLPIPGPVDEVVLIIVAIPLGLFYRGPLCDAWRQAAQAQPSA